MKRPIFSRRKFILSTTATAGLLQAGALNAGLGAPESVRPAIPLSGSPAEDGTLSDRYRLDLSPARWIWYPAGRTLPNTFLHFRKTFRIGRQITTARGWILGECRYLLFCNGQRVQFGPPPSDPRYSEADPVDIAQLLQPGDNVIGVTVLFYGQGEGTWPAGKPGFLFRLDLSYADGETESLLSDGSWQVQLARSWQPGHYKRWYLRALQEEFDARQYPKGWTTPAFQTDNTWLGARELSGRADQTALSAGASDYLFDASSSSTTQLRRRSIPMLREMFVPVKRFVECHRLRWLHSPEEYFDLQTENSFEALEGSPLRSSGEELWELDLRDSAEGVVITFEMEEQVVGWPGFSVEAPGGTAIELMIQEGHRPWTEGGPPLMNNHHHSWTRFVCREGTQELETFDFESVKWLQLHLHGVTGRVRIGRPRVRRRLYDFARAAEVRCSDPALQRLLGASINTVYNNSQDTIVDGMGRERQQYSGDLGHVVHALHRAFGETRLPARFVNTYSQGLTKDGFFMDAWPAYDRLNRLAQRQLDLSPWGPLVDHGVGFNFDCYYHYLYTGHAEDLEEVFPRLARFFQYLKTLLRDDGLLAVENIGVPVVWIDHDAYRMQRHKQCAFNLYVSSMLTQAFVPLCDVFGRDALAREAQDLAGRLAGQVRRRFWSSAEGILINNLPWYREEGAARTCDRSLAHFILGSFGPESEGQNALRELEEKPERMGRSYPPNAQWPHWALAEGGRIQAVIEEFRKEWVFFPSVVQNNAMQETWQVTPDSGSQWSHASISPLYIAYMSIAGILPLEPGYKKFRIRPQPGDLEKFEISNHTPAGPVVLSLSGKRGRRGCIITVPDGLQGELWLDQREEPRLSPAHGHAPSGLRAWRLEPGATSLRLRHT
jgi:alpha-L-rhamnosidase